MIAKYCNILYNYVAKRSQGTRKEESANKVKQIISMSVRTSKIS